MTGLALDDVQRDTFASHLNCVGVPELVRGEPAPHTRVGRNAP